MKNKKDKKPHLLVDDVTNLSKVQAYRLLENAVVDWHAKFELENPLSLSEAVGVISNRVVGEVYPGTR